MSQRTAILLLLVLASAHRALGDQSVPVDANRATCQSLTLESAKCPLRSEGVCHLGDRIAVQANSECLNGWVGAGHDPRTLVPIVNGRLLKGVHGDLPSRDQGTFYFDLRPLSGTETNRQTWVALLSDARNDSSMTWSLGSEDGALGSNPVKFQLEVFPGLVVFISVVGFVVLLVSFLILVRRSDIIRDPGPPPAPGQRHHYSLARAQMAVWFFVVLGTYLYIWLVTGDYGTLTPEVLTLIGISAATGASAMVIDSSTRDDTLRALETERDTIRVRINALQAQITSAAALVDVADLQAELATKRVRQADVRAQLSPASEGIVDILRDGNGVSFHRFQMVGWTVILAIIFLFSAYRDLAMPTFGTTLLGLMGISSGTYLGFKIPQKLS